MPAALPPVSPPLYGAVMARLQESTAGDALAALACSAALVIHLIPAAEHEAALAAFHSRTDAELRLRQTARADLAAMRAP